MQPTEWNVEAATDDDILAEENRMLNEESNGQVEKIGHGDLE